MHSQLPCCRSAPRYPMEILLRMYCFFFSHIPPGHVSGRAPSVCRLVEWPRPKLRLQFLCLRINGGNARDEMRSAISAVVNLPIVHPVHSFRHRALDDRPAPCRASDEKFSVFLRVFVLRRGSPVRAGLISERGNG